MISPREFMVEDFLVIPAEGNPRDTVRAITAINSEALKGSELVDNLILLQFCDVARVHEVLQTKYQMPFAWLNVDFTPPEYKDVAEKHHVLIEKGRSLVVYVPLGQTVDDAMLQIDIPNYELNIRYIADCNYRLLQTGLPAELLSLQIAPFRPLLVFKRLALDCIQRSGTDLHLESVFVEKHPAHKIRYRVKRELVSSRFRIDLEMMQRMIQAVVSKLTPASAADIDSSDGVTTEIRDLFRDGSCDVRISCMRTDAGFYMVNALQTLDTTTKTVDELGFPKGDVETIREIAKRRTGLTLITGEMRSGKNTTIFAMLNEIIDEPIRIVEYSNPVENHMPFPQINYRGDIARLTSLMKMAKKQDIDVAVLNEIPNSEVAFAVRDLVNSAINVVTTTHVNRVWHVPNKLQEFFGKDYKTIISQLNAVVNHKMFIRWSSPTMQKRALVKEQGPFELFCHIHGVTQYFVPQDLKTVRTELQPLTEILVLTDQMKAALLNFDELWKAENMLQLQIKQQRGMLEHKVAEYINAGLMSLDQMRALF